MNGSVVEIPGWFLAIATILMLTNVALFGVLAFVSFQLWRTMSRLEPKVSALVDQVNDDLVPQVKGLVTRVEAIGSNIQGLTGSASQTMGLVQSKTESVGSALETLTAVGMKRAEKYAPWLGYVMMGVRVYQMVATVRANRPKQPKKEKPKALPSKSTK